MGKNKALAHHVEVLNYSRGLPIRRSEKGGIPIQGGQNGLARLGNVTNNLDLIVRLSFIRRSCLPGTPPPSWGTPSTVPSQARATIEVYLFLAILFSEWRGSLTHVGKNAILFFCVILVLYLGHGIFHPVSSFIFLQINFWVKNPFGTPKSIPILIPSAFVPKTGFQL